MRQSAGLTNIETLLPEGEFIYSRTDLKSIIAEANDAFARISAYHPEEMIGQPHNMVRHPDMPAEAFADMWRDLKEGRPWRGIVKNLRRDGGYYWVVVNASPVRENGQVVGYQSVRARPSREEVVAAEEACKSIRGAIIDVRHTWPDRPHATFSLGNPQLGEHPACRTRLADGSSRIPT